MMAFGKVMEKFKSSKSNLDFKKKKVSEKDSPKKDLFNSKKGKVSTGPSESFMKKFRKSA